MINPFPESRRVVGRHEPSRYPRFNNFRMSEEVCRDGNRLTGHGLDKRKREELDIVSDSAIAVLNHCGEDACHR